MIPGSLVLRTAAELGLVFDLAKQGACWERIVQTILSHRRSTGLGGHVDHMNRRRDFRKKHLGGDYIPTYGGLT